MGFGGCVMSGGVRSGSVRESAVVNGLVEFFEGLSANNTTKIVKATTYDNDNDNDNDNDINETARRATYAPDLDRLPSECARHTDPVSEPKCRLSGPF